MSKIPLRLSSLAKVTLVRLAGIFTPLLAIVKLSLTESTHELEMALLLKMDNSPFLTVSVSNVVAIGKLMSQRTDVELHKI